MYFQFLIEDQSSGILVNHIMENIKKTYQNIDVVWNIKPFKGVGSLSKHGNLTERKTGKLLNDLSMYLKGFDKSLRTMKDVAIIVVLDNDNRDVHEFRNQLESLVASNMILCDYSICIAVKETEAWILGDKDAILKAYPDAKLQRLRHYEQDGICETWEVLADIVYSRGLQGLKKKAQGSYHEIGKAKCEWADRIGPKMDLHDNKSNSYRNFIGELESRILDS